jgi:hypothetical protein
MMKWIMIGFLLCLIMYMFSETIEVNLDGSGDFMTIQEGIDASTDGDLVLVYPGRYFENINFNGKTITVGSLNFTTGEEHFIRETIIDGSDDGSCVRIDSGEGHNTTIYGFTITNGAGDMTHVNHRSGGGIMLIEFSHLHVNNCIITDNRATRGGGIFAANSSLFLSGTTIKKNKATGRGPGGIYTLRMLEVVFSTTNRCNIYNNYSPYINDVCNDNDEGSGVDYTVIVDTFTVLEPDIYYLMGYSHLPMYYFEMDYDIMNGYVDEADYDLYVSPDGDNSNSGASSSEPMQSIAEALIRIQADADNPRTIYLAPGIYSTSENDQILPLHLKGYVSLEGAGIEETIIDGDDTYNMLWDYFSSYGYTVSGISFENAYSPNGVEPFSFPYCCIFTRINEIQDYLTFENVRFAYCGDGSDPGLSNYYLISSERSINIDSVIFEDNESRIYGLSILGSTYYENSQTFNITNTIMRNNDNFIGICYFGNWNSENQVNIINLEYTGNHYYFYGAIPGGSNGHGFLFGEKSDINIINCTFSDNTIGHDTGFLLGFFDELNVTMLNTIISGYPYYAIRRLLFNGQTSQNFLLDHCLIEGGYDDIFGALYPELTYGYVLEGNPRFEENGDYPYYLADNSPCINTGTLDMPEGLELPEFDPAGNLRIMGNGIDLGAYEYTPYGNPISEDLIEFMTNLNIYPNPFNPDLTIAFSMDEIAEVEIVIYNTKGQKVRTLADELFHPADYNLVWNGKDDKGQPVSSGVYFVRLKTGNEVVNSKAVLIK